MYFLTLPKTAVFQYLGYKLNENQSKLKTFVLIIQDLQIP